MRTEWRRVIKGSRSGTRVASTPRLLEDTTGGLYLTIGTPVSFLDIFGTGNVFFSEACGAFSVVLTRLLSVRYAIATLSHVPAQRVTEESQESLPSCDELAFLHLFSCRVKSPDSHPHFKVARLAFGNGLERPRYGTGVPFRVWPEHERPSTVTERGQKNMYGL